MTLYIFDLCGLEWPGEGGAPLGVLPEGAAHVDLARVGQREPQPQRPVEVRHAMDLNLACFGFRGYISAEMLTWSTARPCNSG